MLVRDIHQEGEVHFVLWCINNVEGEEGGIDGAAQFYGFSREEGRRYLVETVLLSTGGCSA